MSDPIRILSKDLQRKCKKELNEQPQQIQEDLIHLRIWLQSQPHLRVRNENQWLLCFLRGCKYSLKRVKEKLTMFYTFRSTLPQFFRNRDPLCEEIQDILKLGLFLPLRPTATPDGPRIVLVRCGSVDPLKTPLTSVLKVSLMMIDILLNEDDNFVIGGQLGLIDLSGFTLNHARHVTPSTCYSIAVILQKGVPARPQGFHVMNAPFIFETTYRLMSPFLSKKNRERVSFHSESNLNNLYKNISLDVLPQQYGGKGDCLVELTAYWKKKVEDYRNWFLEDEQYGVTDSNRPDYCEFEDTYDSFRRLEID